MAPGTMSGRMLSPPSCGRVSYQASRRHKLITTSPAGCEQQISTFPSAGAIDRVRAIADRPCHKSGLAGVADARMPHIGNRHAAGQAGGNCRNFPGPDTESELLHHTAGTLEIRARRRVSVIGRSQRRRRSGQSSADLPSMCVPFRRSYGARHIADAFKIGRLAVAHAFDLLMHLRHLGLAEVRRLTDRQRMDIHLR